MHTQTEKDLNLVFYHQIIPTLSSFLFFSFADFHRRKSAIEEQRDLPELSVQSEAQITYHLLRCAKLIMSGLARSNCLECTTLICDSESTVRLSRNEKIKFNLLTLYRRDFCLTVCLYVTKS